MVSIMHNIFMRSFFALFLCLSSFPLRGEIKGKVDIGPTFLSVDILKSGKTEKTLEMWGVKADATILVYQGLCIKPSFLGGWGHGELEAGTLAIGYYIPLHKCFKIVPNVGVTFSYLTTHIDVEPLGLFHLKERFRSSSPFIGMDLCYSVTDRLTVIALYQYAWSHTHTKIRPIVSEKSHTCGPNYSLGLDYSLTQQWSITFGVGYNITLSKEKHGLRGKGARLGVAYYF